jgi:peptidoglycan/LPS O-acetylase OafA/YrhL
MVISDHKDGSQLNFVVALRALAALIIVWHHFALYAPLANWAAPLLGGVLTWLETHARSTQVFFVLGGFVMARSLAERTWTLRRLSALLSRRYCRLGLPYLAVIALVIPVYAFARSWVPDNVIGGSISFPQLLAHLFFLQDILGYEALSAGLWFVCINIQLYALFAFLLWLRDGPAQSKLDILGLAGWMLSAFSLFYANLMPGWDVWAVYFFPYFFMGIIVCRATRPGAGQLEFWLYQAMFAVAMYLEWRWRLAVAMLVGWLLLSLQLNFATRWPANAAVLWLGKISYSLFLVHFPALVFIAAIWTRHDWTSPEAASLGLFVAFALSLALAAAFHRWIEAPSAAASRRIAGAGPWSRLASASVNK